RSVLRLYGYTTGRTRTHAHPAVAVQSAGAHTSRLGHTDVRTSTCDPGRGHRGVPPRAAPPAADPGCRGEGHSRDAPGTGQRAAPRRPPARPDRGVRVQGQTVRPIPREQGRPPLEEANVVPKPQAAAHPGLPPPGSPPLAGPS